MTVFIESQAEESIVYMNWQKKPDHYSKKDFQFKLTQGKHQQWLTNIDLRVCHC